MFFYLLLAAAFLLSALVSYNLGKPDTPEEGTSAATYSREAIQYIKQLKQERDRLQQQVTELEQSVQQANRALGESQAKIRALQQAASARQEVAVAASKPEPQAERQPEPQQENTTITAVAAPTPAASTASDPADTTLALGDVRIEPTDADHVYRLSFSVSQAGSGRVTGTIWIAVNGFTGRQPKRLSFKRLSSDQRSYVRMGFDRQQEVSEEVVLPDDFRPKNVLIEAKPYGDKYTGTSGKFDWPSAG
jgi:hypothetical protein